MLVLTTEARGEPYTATVKPLAMNPRWKTAVSKSAV